MPNIREFDSLLWHYRATFTRTANDGVILIVITAQERTEILYGLIGPDNYGADRTIDGFVRDKDGATIAQVLFPSPLDNESIPMIFSSVAAVAAGQIPDFRNTLILGQGDQLQIRATTPVNGETLKIALRALVENFAPEVASTGSVATVTITETANEFI